MHKVAELTGKFIGNRIADKIVKLKPVPDENPKNVEEIVIPLEKKKRNTKRIKTSIIKWNATKYLNY